MIHVANFQLLPCMQYYNKTDRTVTQADHTLHWRHNDYDGVSNHKPCGCLLNRLFRRRSKKTSKLRVTGLCAENSPGPVNSPHKGPVTRKMFHLMTSSWHGVSVALADSMFGQLCFHCYICMAWQMFALNIWFYIWYYYMQKFDLGRQYSHFMYH